MTTLSRSPSALVLVSVFLLLSRVPATADELKLPRPTADERMDDIRRARIWEPTDVASKDLYNGPDGVMKYKVDQEVLCDFVPQTLSGYSEKFMCRLEDGQIVKVKYYKGNRFKEVYGEVLGTRLFWALGFYADKMLPVRVTCRGCPKDPWKFACARRHKDLQDEQGMLRSLPPDAEVGTYTFDPAAMEEKLDAVPIEEHDDQGWSWKELDLVDEARGGATKAQIDALKLLMAFVQDGDNKYEQNSLVCPRSELRKDESGQVICRRPVMYVDDLGGVFGWGGVTTAYSGRVDYGGWKKREVWLNPEKCKARLASIGGPLRPTTLHDPVVSEEGRALLARLLAQLSDSQIADLFRAARIERLHQTMAVGTFGKREVTVADWVELFKKKRDEITRHPGCESQGRAEAPVARH